MPNRIWTKTLVIAAAWGALPALGGAQQAETQKPAPAPAQTANAPKKDAAQASPAAAGEQTKTKKESPSTSDTKQAAAKVQPRTPPSRVDVDALASNPTQYTGKSVRVLGEIEEFAGPRAFTLDEDSFTATTDVLVVLPRASVVLRDDAEVVVQGVVHQLTRAELERDFSFLDADPKWIMRFDQRPVIMATALQNRKGEDLLVGAKATESTDSKVQDAARPASVEPGAIARTPEKFYGRQLAVKGEIEDVFGPYVFTLDEDALFAGPDVLVIMRKPAAAVTDGADVRVTGTLRRFTWTEIRPDYDFLRLDNDLIVRFENRPVIIADAVSRVADD